MAGHGAGKLRDIVLPRLLGDRLDPLSRSFQGICRFLRRIATLVPLHLYLVHGLCRGGGFSRDEMLLYDVLPRLRSHDVVQAAGWQRALPQKGLAPDEDRRGDLPVGEH